MIHIQYSDGESEACENISVAESAILEAHAEGVSVDWIEDDEGNPYSCLWDVKLQKES